MTASELIEYVGYGCLILVGVSVVLAVFGGRPGSD